MHHSLYIRSKTKAGLDSSCAAIMRPVESKLQKTPPRRRLPEAISVFPFYFARVLVVMSFQAVQGYRLVGIQV